MFNYRVLGLLLVASVVGCAPGFTPVENRPVVLKNYEPGQERSATVGEPIFRVQQAREVAVFTLERDYRFSRIRGVIPAGTRFTAVGQDPEGNLRLTNTRYDASGSFVVPSDGSRVGFLPPGAMRVEWHDREDSPFRRVVDIGDQPGAFTAELIYSGLGGNVVRAVYREYVDNLARPAFTQELQYDLAADRTIAYKSIRIRVLEATNSSIRYEVLSDGGLPWLPVPQEGLVSPAPAR